MVENTKEEEQPAAPSAEKSNKLIPMVLVANTVLMGVVLAVVLLRKPTTASATHESPQASASSNGEKGEGKEEGKGHGAAHGGAAGESGANLDPAGSPGPILKLDNFIIQLRGTDTDRYVRVAFDLELATEGDRSAVQTRMPHIRDAIIAYFSDRSLDELRGSEGMERVKTAVLKKLDEILGAKKVRSVFITELVIQ